jgi:hypothetical protein
MTLALEVGADHLTMLVVPWPVFRGSRLFPDVRWSGFSPAPGAVL